MGFFDIFTTSKAAVDTAKNIVDGTISGIDKLFYTDEEKADNLAERIALHQKGFALWLEAQKALIGESSLRSITRRVLAVMIIGVFLLLLVGAAGVYLVNPEWSAFILTCARALNTLVVAVGVFYFGYYAVSGVVDHIKKKE